MTKVNNEGYEILRVLCGSRAYGLDNPDSDYDYHSIFVVPTSRLLSIGPKIKASSSVGDSEDNTAWELQHFLELALKGNPTTIETFVAPRVEISQDQPYMISLNRIGEELREIFPFVLSRRAIYDSFRGYASSQVHKATVRETNLRRQLKAATAYVRTMFHGSVLLGFGTYETLLPKVPHDRCMFYKDFKGTSFPAKEFEEDRKLMEDTLSLFYRNSDMQEEPNLEKINEFLLKVRKEVW